jgi:hypothetical protein
MIRHFPRSAAAILVLALAGAAPPALAQQPEPPQKPTQSHPGTTNTGKMPDGQLPGPNPTNPQDSATAPKGNTFSQPVPGAMPGSDAVPSTMSERNEASDKLITLAFTFRNLTDAQRRAIYQALKQEPAGKAFNADIGVILPAEVKLHPIPAELGKEVPQTRGYQFTATRDRILLVEPTNRVVVAVVQP